MLILAKAAMALMLGFVLSLITGLIVIPLFRKIHLGQSVSKLISKRHLEKEGTPTMGGVIFILPVVISLMLLLIKGSISISYNLVIIIFVFLAYAFLGFLDDFKKVKYHNNNGISLVTKFLIQMIIALVFFYLFMKGGGDSTLRFTFLGLSIPLGWTFGLFILFCWWGQLMRLILPMDWMVYLEGFQQLPFLLSELFRGIVVGLKDIKRSLYFVSF